MTSFLVKNSAAVILTVAGQEIPAEGQEDFGTQISAACSDFNLRAALLCGTASLTLNGTLLATQDAINLMRDVVTGTVATPSS